MDKDTSSPANTATLPRAKRDVSPTPSSSSFASFRSVKLPLIRKKKKKNKDKKNGYTLDVPENNGSVGGDTANEGSDYFPSPIGTPSSPAFLSPAASPSLARANMNGKSPKNQRKSKEALKSIIKGGKNFITSKGKKESAPVMVEPVLDIRRVARPKDEDDDSDKTDHEPNDVFSENEEDKVVKDTTAEEKIADDDWSVEATNARVKKLSIAGMKESVYEFDEEEENAAEVDVMPTTPEVQEESYDSKNIQTFSSSPNGLDTQSETSDQSSTTTEIKSASTIRNEILKITRKRKTTDPEANGTPLRPDRKISLQARNPSDKNELLFKILVIGELGTGKTSIIKRYVHQFFSQHYRATIGVDFALKVLPWDDETTIRLQLWDIAGQERFGNMTRVYYKEAVGAFIVFDVTRVGTFEAVSKWKQDLDSKVQLPDGGPIPCVLLANKCDQPKEGIVNSPAKMDDFCKENKFVSWFETSAKENINIDEAAHDLVTKIVQNDQKQQQDEKEISNGVSSAYTIALDGKEAEYKKSCAC